MLYEILIIIICMFAALGMAFLAISIFNCKCAKRLPRKFSLLVNGVKGEQAEYIIRYLEELLWVSGADAAINEIILGNDTEIEKDLLERLSREFGNIKKEDSAG